MINSNGKKPQVVDFPVCAEKSTAGDIFITLGKTEPVKERGVSSRSERLATVTGDVILDFDNQNRVIGIELLGFKTWEQQRKQEKHHG